MIEIHRLCALKDNYIFVLVTAEKSSVVIDPSESDPPRRFLRERGLRLSAIWNTHHHWDHVGGNLELQKEFECEVVGAEQDRDRIPGFTRGVKEGDRLFFGSEFEVIEVPGHTSHHIAFYSKEERALFPGDTLFAMGCGRLFEGTAPQLFHSLEKLRALPDDTRVFCAHEYTLSHADFSLPLDPENPELQKRAKEVREKREAGEPTVPFLLGLDKKTNPFLRTSTPAIRRSLHLETAGPVKVFTELRRRKDNF